MDVPRNNNSFMFVTNSGASYKKCYGLMLILQFISQYPFSSVSRI